MTERARIRFEPGMSTADRERFRQQWAAGAHAAVDAAVDRGDLLAFMEYPPSTTVVCKDGRHSECKGENPTNYGCICRCHDRESGLS